MRFKNREIFASYMLSRVTTPEMDFLDRIKAVILVTDFCSQFHEGQEIKIVEK